MGGSTRSGGAWTLEAGSFASIATISQEESEALFALGRTFDRMPAQPPRPPRSQRPRDPDEERASDRWAARADIGDVVLGILEAHGWRHVYRRGDGVDLLLRPGKYHGVSATLGYAGPGVLHVYSTSVAPQFEAERSYSPFSVYAILEHGSDWSAAGTALYDLEGPHGSTFTGSTPGKEAASVPPLTAEEEALFLSVGDVFSDTDPVIWIVPGYVAYGVLLLLVSKIKSGKTQWLLALVRGLLTGVPFMGQRIEADAVIYLTEQGQKPLRDQLERAGLCEDTPGLRFLRLMAVGGRSWEERLSLVERLCRTTYAGRRVVVIVDTLHKWANLKPKEENDSGAMQRAMLPLQRLAQEFDFAVIVAAHSGHRAGTEESTASDAVRGSTALGGDADIITSLTRPPHRAAESARRVRFLHSEGRFGAIPESEAVEWAEDGTYVSLGEVEAYEDRRIERRIEDAIRSAGRSLTYEEIETATGEAHGSVAAAVDRMTSLVGDLRLERSGDGVKGDPYRFDLTPQEEDR